jgi:hypothetical protein
VIEKGCRGNGCGVITDATEAAVEVTAFTGRYKWPGIPQSQRLGKVIADTALDGVEIGVAGDDTDVIAGCCSDEPARRGVGPDCFERSKDNRMMGDHQIVLTGGSLLDQRTDGVEGQQDTLDFLARISDQETDIIPFLCQVIWSDVLENC